MKGFLLVALPVLFLSLSTQVFGEPSIPSAAQIVQNANRLLAEGSYSAAARAYGEAIELDPTGYANYYKRATAYLSMGRHNAALDDFEQILRINPGFVQAHYQRAKILAKEGDFAKAQYELKAYVRTKSDSEAEELSHLLTVGEAAEKSALQAFEKGKWQVCVEHSTKALEVGPNSEKLRRLRVNCATELGDINMVYGDLSRLASLDPSTTYLPLQLSNIAYFIRASSQAAAHIKQCLHFDPDSKPCKAVHKTIRSLEKDAARVRNFIESGTYRQAIKILDGDDGLLVRFEKALDDATKPKDGLPPYLAPQFHPKKNSQMRLDLYALACKASVMANDFGEKGAHWCEETMSMNEENVDSWISRGERLLRVEKWEEAMRAVEKAFELSGRSQDILPRVQKAQRLLKQSKQKDYYKVLGVPRDADERAIKKAFRKAAKLAHPDVGGSEEKMAALNEAYEVLSNTELRQRYDNGDDPNDPTGGQQHNPFAHHGGGMPFQFFQQGGGFQGFHQGFPGGGQKMHFQWN
ncbi:co-chaperone [Cryptococcus neoformans C23]|uniref:Tetratricopeptide repeat and J domain-containing co-chaperone DNJ1 n=1 Tax=Cryptococcus neoformans (strain H99 / ATCC 208821 / CBS 10515 / FGSC 9487) TaxID=235443 RepID=DNJ1_CRYN9|nr:co-chaperone [Cryptococcus neoformans var. grubii H99]J9VKM5.1 RecName: Full=Tetratricopeptide repeat and J domain-containing co-chaperone DNJ1; Flags: Precursor [Cryptococcus neoformans var. grubii H99]AUB24510.1 co-chaperone [Cryptococcus neoformans var. grubii]OWZ44099.1 co-chaperone [Cryptococcus neoformans var. grubii C23]OWZ45080.1 co-chaperone [Cryptococcus neoformans var. grubii AD1-83a]OWZ58378.1 co-chaperone [Cryptococcus neoformans var. grubii 125.91]OXC85062.1 co-chaperone [Cry|eukprot:XP_012049486.1 co-chaperone [Cryptococcus neoformans var. grubii H99]